MHKRSTIKLFYLPALILFAVFVAYPFVESIRLSFTNWNGYSQNFKYVGLSNFLRLLKDDRVRTAFGNTMIYGFGSTLLQNVIGLAYAMLLNTKMRGRGFLRTVIYMPVMISPLVMGYIIFFFVQYNGGVFNDILALFHIAPIDYMLNSKTAILIITFVNSWQYVGISMIIYLAGLQNIPAMYYEAAEIDGVGPWSRFTGITLPLLLPSVSSAVVLNLVGGLKLFDVIMALTYGGPGYSTHSLSTLISNQYFKAQNAGYSATIGLFTFLLIMVVSGVFIRFFDRKGGEQA